MRGGLYREAMNGNTSEIMDRLAEEPDEVKRRAYAGEAMIYAAWKGRLETILALCEAGGDVNHQNQAGQTALMYAAKWGRNDIVELLIQFGARIQTTDGWKRTAINYAKEGNHTGIVKIIENHSENPTD